MVSGPSPQETTLSAPSTAPSYKGKGDSRSSRKCVWPTRERRGVEEGGAGGRGGAGGTRKERGGLPACDSNDAKVFRCC